MLHLLFLPFDILQCLLTLHIHRHIAHRKSHAGVSTDFLLYSWIWASSHTISNCLYFFSSTVSAQYRLRYPVYPHIVTIKPVVLINLVQLAIASIFLKRVVIGSKTAESTSLLCRVIVGCMAAVLSTTLWLFAKGRATVNLLDIADILSTIGSISLAIRLIPQASVNWFSECFTFNKKFLSLQFFSLVCATAAIAVYKVLGISWYDFPVNSPSKYTVMANWAVFALLVYQIRLYQAKRPIGREGPEELV